MGWRWVVRGIHELSCLLKKIDVKLMLFNCLVLPEVKRTVMMTEKCMTCLMMKIQTTRQVNQKAGYCKPSLFFSFSILSFVAHFSGIGRISLWPCNCTTLDNLHWFPASQTFSLQLWKHFHSIREQKSHLITLIFWSSLYQFILSRVWKQIPE